VAKTATKTKQRPSTKSVNKNTSSTIACAVDAGCDAPASETDITIDRRRSSRRDEETGVVEAAAGAAAAPKLERRKKVNRRRQIDPTTCERDYTDQEVEFMNALDDYKRKSGRMFPTCSEVLEVIHSLGYAKVMQGQLAADNSSNAFSASAKPMPQDLQTMCGSELLLTAEEQLV
jgi:hypothetical protein